MPLSPYASIVGVGSYLPERVLSNADLEQMEFRDGPTSDEWITTRTGIKQRRLAAAHQATSDLALLAARRALEAAQLAPEDLDLILVATVTPDLIFPATACLLQHALGLDRTPALDLSAACSGFIYALSMANQYVRTGEYRHVLVVGAEVLSRFTDWQDRGTCVLLGDGAGAVVVSADTGRRRILSTELHAAGRGAPLLHLPAGGSRKPSSPQTVANGEHYIKLEGREVFKFAVASMHEMVESALQEHRLTADDVSLIIPHQANYRIIQATMARLDLPKEKFFLNLERYGNTSSASIPIALDEAHREGRLPEGKHVILVAFGGGLTWGNAVLRW